MRLLKPWSPQHRSTPTRPQAEPTLPQFTLVQSPLEHRSTQPTRPKRSRAGQGAVCLLVTLFTTVAHAQSHDWPQFRGNPQLTGVASSAPPQNLKLLWTYEAGEPIESSAAIVDDTVYFGSHAGELIALHVATGKLKWKHKIAEDIGESSPAVANGLVYIGDLEGVVHARSAQDGKPVWTFKSGSEVKASPVVVGDKLVIGSYDGTLYGLDAKTGKPVWEVRTDGPVHATAGVMDGLAFISGCDGVLRAIRISDGKEAYQVKSGSYTGASPALSGGWAYFGTFDNQVLGVDLKAREIRWRYEHPERKFPFYSSAAIADGKVILGGRDKMLHALNAADGKQLWEFPTRARVESSPVIAGGRVYFGSNDGKFYVVDAKSGAKVWEFTAGAPLSASPAVAGGRIVIGSQDGRVYCLGG